MAASGSIKTSTYEGRGVIFEWSLAGQSIVDNTSTISWTLKGYGSAPAGWYYCGPVNLTINGTKVLNNLNASPNRIQLRDGTLITSGSTSIAHNADGTKTFSVALDASIYLATQNCTGSASFTLNTIPRASTFGTITGSTIGSAITININRMATAFVNKLYYSFEGGTKTAINTNAGTGCNWTPPLATLGARIPNAIAGTCTLYLETYNGSAKVGDTATKTLTLTLPDSAKPSISTISVAEANSKVSSVCPGVYLQTLSKLKITTTAAGVYGSTIKKYDVTFEEVKYTGQTVTTNAVKGSGTLAIQVTVTDSRNRSFTKSQNVTIAAYAPPKITLATIRRNVTTSTTVNCVVSGSVSSVKSGSTEKNTCTAYILYATSTTYPAESDTYKVTTSGLTFSNVAKNYTGLSNTASYYFKVIVRDKFTFAEQYYQLSTAAVIMDINKSGYVGIGKYREAGKLDVGGDTYIRGTLFAVKNTDASGGANNQPALIVGGAVSAAHLEMDANELMAKANATSVAPLYLNADGGLVTVGGGGLQVNGAATINTTATIKGYAVITGNTANGAVKTAMTTSTWLNGNKGRAIINSTAGAGAFTMLAKLNSTNGYFTDGVYNGQRIFNYTAKTTVDAGTNDRTKNLVLLDESGNSKFPGTITASNYSGPWGGFWQAYAPNGDTVPVRLADGSLRYKAKKLYEGRASSGTLTLTDAMLYSAVTILAYPGSDESWVEVTIPTNLSNVGEYPIQLAGDTSYISWTVKKSGNNIQLVYKGGSGAIRYVYAI